jgi:hypothetical protein
VYDEKIALLDKQLSQEVKQYQTETRQIKYVITQLVKQKKDLEKELKTKTTVPALITKTLVPVLTTKTPNPPVIIKTPKPPALSSPNLKKPNFPNPKSNVKFTDNIIKKALTLKTSTYIKFNQIQIESIEKKHFNTPSPRQVDINLQKINEINNMDFNTPTLRQGDDYPAVTLIPTIPLPQTPFETTKVLPKIVTLPQYITPQTDPLLIKKNS